MNSIVVPSPLVGEGQGEGEAAGPLQAFTLSPNPSPLKREGSYGALLGGHKTLQKTAFRYRLSLTWARHGWSGPAPRNSSTCTSRPA